MKKKKMMPSGISAVLLLAGCAGNVQAQNETETAVTEETAVNEEISETVSEEETAAYDTSVIHEAAVINADEEITGGTYIADETDESVLDVSGGIFHSFCVQSHFIQTEAHLPRGVISTV